MNKIPDFDNIQNEDEKDAAIKAHYIEKQGALYAGQHLIIDLFDGEHLDDKARMEACLRACIEKTGATLLHIHLHSFGAGQGLSGVAVLAESHISVHSWPETGYCAFDVFMCGNAVPEAAVDVIKAHFPSARVDVKAILRGHHQSKDS